MESGTPPPDRPADQPGGEPPPPAAPGGPESPGGGPESPVPPQGPQSPAPGPQSPQPGWEAPPPPGPQPPAPGTPGAPPYTGPQPPGGWQAPPAPTPSPWAGAPLAGWGSRAGAVLLDILILLVPIAVIIILAIAVAQGSNAGAAAIGIIGVLAYLFAVLFYAPLLMQRQGQNNGQTWGKQIVGIRVVRDSGEAFTVGSAFVREFVVKNLLFGFVGGFFLSIPTLVDWLWPLWDGENRCLHDMVVSTHVLRA
jgi:uncharacterized RDD family membrane protein YckC